MAVGGSGSFWGIHLVTLVFESVLFLLPLHQFSFTQARAVFYFTRCRPIGRLYGQPGFGDDLFT